jgi:hypothetical protein
VLHFHFKETAMQREICTVRRRIQIAIYKKKKKEGEILWATENIYESVKMALPQNPFSFPSFNVPRGEGYSRLK